MSLGDDPMPSPATPVITVPRQRRGEPPVPAPPAPRPVRLIAVTAAAWLAGAWAVAFGAHALGVAWLLLPLVLVLTASLMRGGRTLLDRLMFALAVLLGAACAAGLLFTVWPFGLSPVAAGGLALTVLGLFQVVTGRVPRLPRPHLSDLIAPLGSAAITFYMARPYLHSDLRRQLSYLLSGEDGARHLATFDSINRAGGYLFTQSYRPDMPAQMLRYPQGWHLTSALLDGFLPHPARTLDGFGPAWHYVFWVLAGFGLFVLTIIWAAQWVAGTRLSLGLQAVLGVAIVGFVAISSLPGLLTLGFPSEAHGLTLVAMLTAVLSRSTARERERIVMIGLLVVGIGMSYYLLLPMAGIATLVWLVRNRSLPRRYPWTVGAVTVLTVLVAPIATVVGILRDSELTGALNETGGVVESDRLMVVVMAAVVIAGVLSPAGRRSPTWRSYQGTALVAGAIAGTIWLMQRATAGHSGYYFEKVLHAFVVVAIVGLGAAALLLPEPPLAMFRRLFTPLRARAHLLALVVVLLASLLFVLNNSDYRRETTQTVTNPARKWNAGISQAHYAKAAGYVLAAQRQYHNRERLPTIVLCDDWAATYQATLFLAAVQRTSGGVDDIVYNPDRKSIDLSNYARTAQVLMTVKEPLRIIAATPNAMDFVQYFRYQHPERPVTLLWLDNSLAS